MNYRENSAIVLIDKDIAEYYYALIPKAYKQFIQKSVHQPHISVVRKEIPKNLFLWGRYEGRNITFEYENVVKFDGTYYWIDVLSKELIDIRLELGLPPSRKANLFHITLGNQKKLNEKLYGEKIMRYSGLKYITVGE